MRGAVEDLHETFEKLKPTAALQFPFPLDAFQKEAIVLMEQVCLKFKLSCFVLDVFGVNDIWIEPRNIAC